MPDPTPDTPAAARGSMNDMTIERTGNIFSFGSSEFRVTYPDGHTSTIWSPPWNEMGPEEEMQAAKDKAAEWFALGTHRDTGRERFVRNNAESVRIMRAKAVQLRRGGDEESARRVDDIADVWDRIGAKAERSDDAEPRKDA